MFGDDIGINAAAHIETGGQAHEARLSGGNQIIENTIGNGFVKGALVTVRPDVELERLQFHALGIRHVFQMQRGKIRLAGLGAKTGKFGHVDANGEIAIGARIVEGFKRLAGLRGHGVRLG